MGDRVTKRFVECVNYLKEQDFIRSFRQFSNELGYAPQNLSDIRKGRRSVTISLLEGAITKYHLNPEYIFSGEGPKVLRPEEKENQMRVLPIVTDQEDQERIVHVPVSAQAGYAAESRNPEYIGKLQNYSLPDYRFKTGTFRSFDVKGESMEPSFIEGDRLICGFVEPNMWKTSLKEGQVYVVVTKENILVKRVTFSRRHQLKLHSDNESFDPYEVHFSNVKEIWHVKYKLSSFDHSERPRYGDAVDDDVEQLRSMMDEQQRMIEHQRQMIRQQSDMIDSLQSNLREIGFSEESA